jgi:hypothetical protein
MSREATLIHHQSQPIPWRIFLGSLGLFSLRDQSFDRQSASRRQRHEKEDKINAVISIQNSMGLPSLVTRRENHDPASRNTSPVAKPS